MLFRCVLKKFQCEQLQTLFLSCFRVIDQDVGSIVARSVLLDADPDARQPSWMVACLNQPCLGR